MLGVHRDAPLHMIDTSDRNLVKIFREITLTQSRNAVVSSAATEKSEVTKAQFLFL